MHTLWRRFTAILLGAALAGCGGGDPTEEPSAGQPEAAAPDVFTGSGLKWRQAADLPAVGQPQLADEGRLEVAGPEGWHAFPDNSKYLARYSEKPDQQPPWISVFAGDSPLPILGDLKEESQGGQKDNVEKFRELMQDDLLKFPNPRIQEPCKPLMIGDTVFIRHVRLRSGAGVPLVIQALQTVQGGRLYTVELTCRIAGADPADYADSLTQYRDQAYAVAANLQFPKAASAAAAAPLATEAAKKSP